MPKYVFTLAEGHTFRRRSLGFLEDKESGELDAFSVFRTLKESKANLVRSRFDLWLQGQIYNKYFHGWGEAPYDHCFVFKWEDRHVPQRLYGFLFHPTPTSNAGLLSCALVYFDTKESLTNYTVLDRINRLRVNIEVTQAIAEIYPEYGGKSKWKN